MSLPPLPSTAHTLAVVVQEVEPRVDGPGLHLGRRELLRRAQLDARPVLQPLQEGLLLGPRDVGENVGQVVLRYVAVRVRESGHIDTHQPQGGIDIVGLRLCHAIIGGNRAFVGREG